MPCVLVSSEQKWNVIGMYIPPLETNGDTVNYVDEAVWYHGTENPYILLGDLNDDLDQPSDTRSNNILSMIVLLGLEDVGDYYSHPHGRWTWSMR
jgi:hypothetical protein